MVPRARSTKLHRRVRLLSHRHFAAKGWAVLRPNPRGSSAYGRTFRGANLNDWGGGDYNDIMTGVDYVISEGIADPNRMVVMGWSYGGYMTNWVVTQTTRFKAAAAGAGLSNMPSMWGTNDIPAVLDDYFSGPSYEQSDRYVKLSPLYNIKNAVTPMSDPSRRSRHPRSDVARLRDVQRTKAEGRRNTDGRVSAHAARTARTQVRARYHAKAH